jgi:chromosome segregation ATPase
MARDAAGVAARLRACQVEREFVAVELAAARARIERLEGVVAAYRASLAGKVCQLTGLEERVRAAEGHARAAEAARRDAEACARGLSADLDKLRRRLQGKEERVAAAPENRRALGIPGRRDV